MTIEKKTFIYSLLIVIIYLISSCENPMVQSILPDVDNNDNQTSPEDSYVVIYNANGGKGEMISSVFSIGISKSLLSNTFTRTGYVFAGWALSAEGGVEYTDKAEVKDLDAIGKTITLYAVWERISYTVEYNANGGDGDMDNSDLFYDESKELRTNNFSLGGYIFAGWSTTEDGDVEYADEDSVINLTSIQGGKITLYAKWGTNIFTVSYIAKGGNGHMAPGVVTLGQEYTLKANTFTREGYFFIGWSLLNNGEVHLEDEDIIQNTEDITVVIIRLYAVWLPDMIVTWPVDIFAVYGQTLSDLWLPDSYYSKVSGVFSWAASDVYVGDVGVRLHTMIFTPEDLFYYNIVTQEVEITVLPKFVDITGTPGRTLIPFDSADTLYGKTSTLEIMLDGLLNGDTVTLVISEGYGLSLSGNTEIENNTQRTINVIYDGTTISENGHVSLELYISDNDNYMLYGASDFELNILDGQSESRAIPVTQANIAVFNSYANTGSGLAKYYKQVQNITLNHISNWESIGTNNTPFTGSFDGNGFTITNITINRTAAYQGLFGYIGTGGMLRNIGIINGNVIGGNYTGSVSGYNNGIIQNCYVTGNVSGSAYTGSVSGFNNGTIQNCYSISSVSGSNYVSGVAGQNNGIVQNCYATGKISGTNYIGGVVGYNNGSIRNCTALNSIITTSGSVSASIGRIVGYVSGGTLSNNYARNDMGVKNSWNGSNGNNKTITTTGVHNSIDGYGIGQAQYNTQSWWITAGNWYSGDTWNFSNIWAMNANNIPRLKTAGGSQNHELSMGDGTEANPFRVYNEATLKKVGTGTDGWSLNKHYLQIQDITLALPLTGQSNWIAIGTTDSRFIGIYDGGGYKILNLAINSTADNQGMFRFIETGGVVKNLGLIDSRVSGGNYTGSVAGYNAGTIQDCYMTGIVNGNNSYNLGGVVGENYGMVRNCYSTGTITGYNVNNSLVGGMVGTNNGTVQNCYTTGNITSNYLASGVVGVNYSMVENCYATGNIAVNNVNNIGIVGGVVGHNDGTVQNCYMNGNVAYNGNANNTCYVGGLIGVNDGMIRNNVVLTSILTTTVNSYIGRIVGFSNVNTLVNNYARGDMTVKYGSTGTNKTISAGLTTIDGANIGSVQYNALSWWQNSTNWNASSSWNFTSVWEINANNLPKLKNAGGIQDHFVQAGDGTETNPFPVYDVDTLRKVGSGTDGWSLNKHYRQVQDITLNYSGNWEPIGSSSNQFTGSFDGNGFIISNLNINRTATYQGLFGYIGTGGVVKNIGLVNVNIKGGNYTGGVSGYSNGMIQNCYVTGSVNGSAYTGGVAGFNNGTMQNCYGISSVSGSSSVGGIAGQNNSIVQNCYATGSISGSSGNIGGVVGNGGTVRNCVALNPSVTTAGNNTTVGRVLGTGSGSYNYARSDMAFKFNWNGFAGINKTISASLTTTDGANITTAQWNNTSWWQTTANWNTASGASVWNFTNIWLMNVNNLPKLRNTGGAQNHVLNVYVDFMEIVRIPSGNFTMGSPSSEVNRFDDEGPQHTVTLTGFSIGKYPVTQTQYQIVTGTNPSGFKTTVAGENTTRLPVEQVTWYDAVEFCNKLSQLEGLTPVYTISGRTPATGYPITNATVTANLSNNGYRLPTEAQWEYACRAGTSTAYSTGVLISDNTGWYNANSSNTTHEVGKKPANAWGLYDMHGNVWEWCWDFFGNYSSAAQTNPTGVSSGLTRVTRGGSWYSSSQGLRSACRNGDLPSGQFANLGFRVVRP